MRLPWRYIRECPSPDFLRSLNAKLGVDYEVIPHGDRWEWGAWFTFDGHRSLLEYAAHSWRRPSPYEIRGRCRDQMTAMLRAREAADDARARYAETQVVETRRHVEGFRL